ncbi:PP2C family protein-serine/threonine phosphatase [Lentzea xinjiangensis]|uniref:PP2C family protein-serine/threonine phosphatase n=1 Tax=Lentzea xinjiangensis TaxID=402600 RepID=UPI001FE6165B|nr:GAF domain-containing SpoIIE family protein phosphatase [Lentzea xinjiangensis]
MVAGQRDASPLAAEAAQVEAARMEATRMEAVRRYDILDTPPDGAFDRVARLAARWFDVPIASVTIVDEDRIWFKSAHGLDGVTQIGRDPGLCGSAILDDDTYVVTDAVNDPRACDNPLVASELGVRFYAAAPIATADGHRLGTVNVIDTKPRGIDEAGMATLRDLAAVVMDELELRLSALHRLRLERELREQAERDRAEIESFATTLQRSLVPPALPRIPGLELAAHYRTASARLVGGDFYDVFPLAGGRWAVVLGDVCGKGAAAASLTSFIRYTLRSLATHHDDPVAVLSELNAAMIAEQSLDTLPKFCTAAFAVLSPNPDDGDPTEFEVVVAAGGHPPPYLLPAAGGAQALATPHGMLIGMLPDARFITCTARLRPGDALVFYTDGLTEARTHTGEEFGEQPLEEFLATHTGCRAAELTGHLVTLLDRFDPRRADDVALLTLSMPPTSAHDGVTRTETTATTEVGDHG